MYAWFFRGFSVSGFVLGVSPCGGLVDQVDYRCCVVFYHKDVGFL